MDTGVPARDSTQRPGACPNYMGPSPRHNPNCATIFLNYSSSSDRKITRLEMFQTNSKMLDKFIRGSPRGILPSKVQRTQLLDHPRCFVSHIVGPGTGCGIFMQNENSAPPLEKSCLTRRPSNGSPVESFPILLRLWSILLLGSSAYHQGFARMARLLVESKLGHVVKKHPPLLQHLPANLDKSQGFIIFLFLELLPRSDSSLG